MPIWEESVFYHAFAFCDNYRTGQVLTINNGQILLSRDTFNSRTTTSLFSPRTLGMLPIHRIPTDGVKAKVIRIAD